MSFEDSRAGSGKEARRGDAEDEARRVRRDRENRLWELAREADGIEKQLKRREWTKQKLEEAIWHLSAANAEARNFLLQHLAVVEESLVLTQRLYYPWQQYLVLQEIIVFDDKEYLWVVEDAEGPVEETQENLKANKGSSHLWFDPSEDPWNDAPDYREDLLTGLSLQQQLQEVELIIIRLAKARNELWNSILQQVLLSIPPAGFLLS